MDLADLNICDSCGGLELQIADDGFMYCTVCASQSQNYQEECFDDDHRGAFNRNHVREYNVARNQGLASQVQAQLEAIFGDDIEDAPFATFLDDCGPDTVFGAQYPNFAHQVACQYSQHLGSTFASCYLAAQIEAASKAAAAQASQSGSSSQGLSQQSSKLAALASPELRAQVESILFERFSNSVRKTYIQGLERMMQMQCETLMRKFKVTPVICGAFASIWPRFLAASHIFDRDWAQEALDTAEAAEKSKVSNKRRVKKVTAEEEEEEEEEEVEEEEDEDDDNMDDIVGSPKQKSKKTGEGFGHRQPRTSFNVQATDVWLRALKQRVPLRITLAIVYLACYMARETILPTDITRWAHEGSLPYLAAFTELVKPVIRNGVVVEEAMQFPLSVRVMFQPNSMTSARNVELLAGHIADMIGLQVPPVNFHGIFGRFAGELGLPVHRLMIHGDRLYQWYTPPGLWLSAREEDIPTRVYVMAMLVVLMKIFYKIDGQSGDEEEDEAANRNTKFAKLGLHQAGKGEREKESRSCDEWPTRQMLEKLEYLQQNFDTLEFEKDLESYTKYCQDVIFPPLDLTYDEQKFQTRFRRVFEKLSKQKSREELAAHGETSGTKKVAAVLEPSESQGPFCSLESRVIVNPGLRDKGKGKMVEEPPEEQVSPEEPASPESDSDELEVESVAFPAEAEEEVVRTSDGVVEEMYRMGFASTATGLGKLRSDSYLRYSFAKGKTGQFSVHKDYFKVLRACSKLLKVHPQALHLTVQNVEKGLRKIEVTVEAFITTMQTLDRERTEGNKEPGLDL